MEEQVKSTKSSCPQLIVLNSSNENYNVSPKETFLKNEPHKNRTAFKENSASPFKLPLSPLKALKSPFKGRTSLTPLDLNTSVLMPRESLGILPSDILSRDSLEGGFHISVRDAFEAANVSARDSLGILNISEIDLGPVNIFDIKNTLEESKGNIEETTKVLKIPNLIFDLDQSLKHNEQFAFGLETGNSSPYNLSCFNTGFLYPNSIKQPLLSASSGRSTVPSCNSYTSEEISIIPPSANSLQQDPSLIFEMFKTDIFNQGFEGSEVMTNLASTTFTWQTNKEKFSTSLENVRNRIQSLPVTFEEKVLAELGKEGGNQEDSVFLDPNEPGDDAVFEGRHLLDSISQPDWPDSSGDSSNKGKEKCNEETVSKTVDNKLEAHLLQVEDEPKINSNKNDGNLPLETSASISQISKNSCDDNSLTHGVSNDNDPQNRATQTSAESAMKILMDLSNIIQEDANLSTSQKQEGQHVIDKLSDILCRSQNKTCSLEDSGRSSGDDHSNVENGQEQRSLHANNDESVQSRSVKSVGSDPKVSLLNKKDSSTRNGYETKMPVTGLKRTKTSVSGSVRNGPLRAIIPVEDMAKINTGNLTRSTTPKKENVPRSKRTSTPIQEPKMKPVASSTPTADGPFKFPKDGTVSPTISRSKPAKSNLKDSPSVVGRPKTSSVGLPRLVANRSTAKSESKLFRRNSTSDLPKEGATLKRSHSLGKESKIQLALGKVRQNILNSPYYAPRQSAVAAQAAGNQNRKLVDVKSVASGRKVPAMVPVRRNSNKENGEAL
ncbi:uncharacterized protein LOC132703408 isoform X2 [Cylas formicarius]|uniref:uncharacterized protein LOC132703408 isoform X2 n=1 Tax=Cylas formicarius TaxID=197179 RepID=UPI0029583B9F|nr:uncharacterized protein LOC132703408 isoform X2 [Cylas formicarius]